MLPLLNEYQNFLSTGALKTKVCEASAENPFPYLQIHLKPDLKGRERQITLQVHQQALLSPEKKEEKTLRLSLKHSFPFQGTIETNADLGSLLHFLNNHVDFPGFVLDEASDQISYRTVWFSTEEGVTQTVLQGVVGFVLLMLDAFQGPIEEIASGEKTFTAFLEEFVEESEELAEEPRE